MQTQQQRDGVRTRLRLAITKAYGPLTPGTLRLVAEKARVHYTSLARYLTYTKKSTRTLRRQTLQSVAIALDTSLEWLRDGQGSRQMGLWPMLLPPPADAGEPKPEDQLGIVIRQVQALGSSKVKIRAYRAAVAAILEVVTSEGASLDGEAYRCLMQLDALRRPKPTRAAG